MILSVELTFDPASTQRLAALWHALAGIYGGPSLTELGTQPHLSLTVFREGESVDFLPDELARLAQRFAPFRANLGASGSFPTTEGVLYLAPDPSPELQAIHSAFHARLAAHNTPGHAYYRPNNWVPHCTVATDVPQSARAAVAAHPAITRALGPVTVDAIQSVAYRPARVWHRAALSGSPSATNKD